MMEFQKRVVEEKEALDIKLNALEAFKGTAVFEGLPDAEKNRLVNQSYAMREYSNILGDRIAAFEVSP